MDSQVDRSALVTAPAKAKPYEITVGKELSLLVNPNGSKLWRLRALLLAVESEDNPNAAH